MGKKRIEELDALRGWAIFLVVLGHSVIYYPVDLHQDSFWNSVYELVISTHMPLFFLLSGFCFYYETPYKKYIAKKIKRILIPYIIFNILDTSLRTVLSSLVNRPRSVRESIVSIALYGGEYWFLYVLFIILAVSPSFYKYLNNKKTLIGLIILTFIATLFDCRIQTFQLGGLIYYFLWFEIGMLIKRENITRIVEISDNSVRILMTVSVGIIWVLLSLKIGIGTNFAHNIVALVGICFSVCLCSFNFFRIHLKKTGVYSLQIYLLNGFVLVISRTIACRITSNPTLIVLVNVGMCYFISYIIIVKVLLRSKAISHVMGMV